MTIEKILFPTDFSLHSDNALYYAVNLAGALGAGIVLFHCYTYPDVATDIPVEGMQEEMKAIERERHRRMAELIEYGSRINADVSFDAVLKYGNFTNHIAEVTGAHLIDLIVMSTEGAGMVKALTGGTNAAKVIDKSPCPVLVVPKYYSFEPIKHILFPSEYFDSDIKDIEWLSALAAPFQASITVVTVAGKKGVPGPVATDFESEVRKAVTYSPIEYASIDGEDIYEAIKEYTLKAGADLIVMATRQRNVLEKIYDPSLTRKMAYHTSIPLLAFHVEDIYQD